MGGLPRKTLVSSEPNETDPDDTETDEPEENEDDGYRPGDDDL